MRQALGPKTHGWVNTGSGILTVLTAAHLRCLEWMHVTGCDVCVIDA